MIIAFCGHSVVAYSKEVERWMIREVEILIEEGGTSFYLGGYGEFDHIALRVMRRMKKSYPHIENMYIQAYLDRPPWNIECYDGTIYPPIEMGPLRFAIVRRNKWIAEVADVILSYITHDTGGASTMLKHAEKYKKRIIRFEI